MKYSYKWLSDLTGVSHSVDEMAQSIMMHAFEVDDIIRAPEHLRSVVVGEILDVQSHPDADKLSLTKVKIADGEDPINIVCGAKNISVGDKVPVALPGTLLPNGVKIQKTTIRGRESMGMLCAMDELGLGDDHSGILQLAKDAPIGTALGDVLGKNDTVLDISILANRGHDVLSHVGMAREVSAINGKTFTYTYPKRDLIRADDSSIDVQIEDSSSCKRYVGAVLSSVTVGPSPAWLRARLETCGIRSINNVVDVTNYVMLEIGQPMHAFDFDIIADFSAKQKKASIIVRRAKEGESIHLLNEMPYGLGDEDVVIANNHEILAVAGVMGGLHSAISDKTTTIVLEAACFDPVRVRRSRNALGILTESSYRFEREIDPELAGSAIARAIELLEETAGAVYVDGVDVYSKPIVSETLFLRTDQVTKLLGKAIELEEMTNILERIGCQVNALLERRTEKNWKPTVEVHVPTWRLDLRSSEDLTEEIGRIHGYEKIQPQPLISEVRSSSIHPVLDLEDKIRMILISLGMDEILSYSFYSKEDANVFELDLGKHYSLQNPMNPNQELVRASLVPNIVRKAKENLRYFDSLSLFEIGKFSVNESESDVMEKREAVLLRVLPKEGFSGETFFDLKGSLEAAFWTLLNHQVQISQTADAPSVYHPTRCAHLVMHSKKIGLLGEIHPLLARNIGISKRIALCQLDISALAAILTEKNKFRPLNKYPVVERDISLLIGSKTYQSDVCDILQKIGGDELRSIVLFDDFHNDGQRSLAFHLFFASEERTLSGVEIDERMKEIFHTLAEKGMQARTA